MWAFIKISRFYSPSRKGNRRGYDYHAHRCAGGGGQRLRANEKCEVSWNVTNTLA